MPVQCVQGDGKVCITFPYVGTDIQRTISARLRDENDVVSAPDRYLERVVATAFHNATKVRANFHRYLSDADQPDPKSDRLPMKGMMGVVPLLDRDGNAIWSLPPTPTEAASWRSMFYAPYHAAIAAETARIRARHGSIVIVNCRAKRQTSGNRYPADMTDIDLCSHLGRSCSIRLSTQIATMMKCHGGFTSALKTRVSAGWTTRHYGKPSVSVHAMDLNISEDCYLTSIDGDQLYDEAKAAQLLAMLSEIFQAISDWQGD